MVEGEDYFVDRDEVILNNPTFNSIVAASRSTDGVDAGKMPQLWVLSPENYVRFTKKTKNTWMSKRRVPSNFSIQLSLLTLKINSDRKQ